VHRSIRKFTSQQPANEVIDYILQKSIRASNTGNMQPYSIVVTTDAALLERLNACHYHQPASKAPVQLTFCADFNRFSKWCLQRSAQPGYSNFLSFLVAYGDAMLASQNACLAAEEKGLGICYLGTVLYNADKIIEILGLPKGVVPVASIALGYPAEQPPLTDRLPLEAVVHRETYRDYSPEDIDRLYKVKEELSFHQELLAVNKKETLSQIFTDIRYPKSTNEAVSAKLFEVLKNQGFL
jgi:nitroreductase